MSTTTGPGRNGRRGRAARSQSHAALTALRGGRRGCRRKSSAGALPPPALRRRWPMCTTAEGVEGTRHGQPGASRGLTRAPVRVRSQCNGCGHRWQWAAWSSHWLAVACTPSIEASSAHSERTHGQQQRGSQILSPATPTLTATGASDRLTHAARRQRQVQPWRLPPATDASAEATASGRFAEVGCRWRYPGTIRLSV